MRHLLFALLCCFGFSCEENEPIIINEYAEESPYQLSIVASGMTIEDQVATHQTGFQLDETYNYLHDGCSSGGDLGSTLIVGMAEAGTSGMDITSLNSELVRLQFWSADFSDQGHPSEASFNALFVTGNTFLFGRGPGFVNVGYLLEFDETSDRLSQSSFLYNPQGELTILSVEPHQYNADYLGFSTEMVSGYNVTCSFAGEIGVFDREAFRLIFGADILDFRTEEKAYISGEFSFFVELE